MFCWLIQGSDTYLEGAWSEGHAMDSQSATGKAILQSYPQGHISYRYTHRWNWWA